MMPHQKKGEQLTIPVDQVRDAVKKFKLEGDLTYRQIANILGYRTEGGLLKAIGIKKVGGVLKTKMQYTTAVRIIEGLNLDPVDYGL